MYHEKKMKEIKKIEAIWINENVPNNSLKIKKEFEVELPNSLNEIMEGDSTSQNQKSEENEFNKYLSDLINKFLFNRNQKYVNGTWSLSRGGDNYLDLTLKDGCEELNIHIRDEVNDSEDFDDEGLEKLETKDGD